jgi:hypothetical protein
MTLTLTLLLVIFALLIGYGLGRTATPSLRKLEGHLEAIGSSLSQLTKALCGDKDIETSIRMTNDAGFELSAENLAYRGGSLRKIETAIGGLGERVGRLAEAAKKASP